MFDGGAIPAAFAAEHIVEIVNHAVLYLFLTHRLDVGARCLAES